MHERFLMFRNTLGLTQEDVALRIGLRRTSISMLENGGRKITDRVVTDVCREFNVNEDWLRNGEGKMFINPSPNIIDELTNKFNLDEFDKTIILDYSKLKAEHKQVIKDFIMGIHDAYKP